MTNYGHYSPAQPVQSAPVYAAPVYAAPQQRDPADSVGSWMLTIFLLGLPLVGLIYLLVVAFGGSSSESKQNFARASLIWYLISIVLTIILFVVLAASGAAFFNWVVEFDTAQTPR
ncbi:MAG: hypothetical protein GXX90_09025 [Microbacteriaceae bacterium]|nr:hypothetical protein [Microbacteriaceae bacterium]